MKLAKSLLLGSAAGLVTVGAAHAADLPTRKAAPVEYVRVCDAYGAGFFYIPGTDTCLRVGGLVLAQTRIQNVQFGATVPAPGGGIAAPINAATFTTPYGLPSNTFFGALPPAAGFGGGYRPANGLNRDLIGYDAAARVELDARTQSPYGTVRTFVRVQGTFGSGLNATTGNIQSILGAVGGFNNSINATAAKDFVYLDKAFIQFAGLTAGRVQSFFDFYADAINYESLRGANNNVWSLAYTWTFGGGFSATLAVEDSTSHRGPVGNVVGINGLYPYNTGAGLGISPAGLTNISGFGATQAASRVPDVIFNVRIDQPWGAAQLSAALHPVRALLTPAQAIAGSGYTGAIIAAGTPGTVSSTGTGSITDFGTQPYGLSVAQTTSYGFAVQAGVQLNLDNVFGTNALFAAGDKLWLQATYSRGGVGYTDGANMAFVSGPNSTAAYGIGLNRASNGYGYQGTPYDCVFTYRGKCELSDSFAMVAALKHYWTPTISSGLFGSYYVENYPNTATNPIGFPTAANTFLGATNVGVTNYKEIRLGTNLVWTPVKNFDLGAEATWIRSITGRPYGMAPNFALNIAGLPSFRSTVDEFYGKLRAIRAF